MSYLFEHTRVGYLLDAIESTDAGLQAAIAQVRTDDGAGGKRNDFESTASFLLPYDPVAKKRAAGTKRDCEATISDVNMEVDAVEGFGTKPGIGKTGVHLCYHEKHKYKELTKAQRLELKEWREKKQEKGDKSPAKKKAKGERMNKKQIAAISKAVAKHMTEQQKAKDDDDNIDAIIMSLQSTDVSADKSKVNLASNTKETTQVNTSALKSILCRAKNSA